jgi:hypothetical protein
MIEIKRSSAKDADTVFELLFDGQPASESSIRQRQDGGLYAWIEENDYDQFFAYTLSELPGEVEFWHFSLIADFSDLFEVERIERSANQESYQVQFRAIFTFADWSQPFSFNEYYNEFKLQIQESKLLDINIEPSDTDEGEEFVENGFYLKLEVPISIQTIDAVLKRCEQIVCDLNEAVEKSLREKTYGNAIVTYFNFPSEVKVACEQYLLFFVDFLRDMGIEAKADIQEKTGEVLFVVAPNDKRTALEKIRLALEIFLQLPAEQIEVSPVLSEDAISIQRLSANIHHLKSQLMLAQALLQTKDATIQAQQTTIEYQQRLLSGEVVLDSMRNREKESADKEDLLGGAVAITKYEGKGFEINLPELFRRLRQYFGREETD